MDDSASAASTEADDVTRRTWLAAERTWLAWWRTGLGAAAVALAVGRFLPGVVHGTRWPFYALGIGYALLAVVVVVTGAVRQRRSAAALREGGFAGLPDSVVFALTTATVVLALATVAEIASSL